MTEQLPPPDTIALAKQISDAFSESRNLKAYTFGIPANQEIHNNPQAVERIKNKIQAHLHGLLITIVPSQYGNNLIATATKQ
jgi:hypothetical protein